VFEPNGPKTMEPSQTQVGSFMRELFEQGAFQRAERKDAYFVKCDANTMTPADIARET